MDWENLTEEQKQSVRQWYTSPQYKLSNRLLGVRIEKNMSREVVATYLRVSMEKYELLESGDTETTVGEYESIISKLSEIKEISEQSNRQSLISGDDDRFELDFEKILKNAIISGTATDNISSQFKIRNLRNRLIGEVETKEISVQKFGPTSDEQRFYSKNEPRYAMG